MEILKSLDEKAKETRPFVLTIGNFDGVHEGHRFLLEHAKELAKREGIALAALTFENHPSTLLRPNHPALLLTTPLHKERLLKKLGVDLLISLHFTKELSLLTAQQFLTLVHERLPFRTLVLGYDAKIGNDRLSDGEQLNQIARMLHFQIESLAPRMHDKDPISSSRIRHALQEGNLKEVEILLGRPFSYLFSYAKEGFSLEGLATPLFGTYAAAVQGKYPAVALIHYRKEKGTHVPFLELTPIPQNENCLEIILLDYLHPEQTTDSSEKQKELLQKDLSTAALLINN